MFTNARGQVVKIIFDLPELQEILVKIAETENLERAYNYPLLYHSVELGEEVWLNTSAVKLGLGTGGRHFVVPESSHAEATTTPGHIMKLRYTPWQFPILAGEEEASSYHQLLTERISLAGTPVVAAALHSMLPGIVLGFHQALGRTPKIAYIMTDGAALPLALSNLVRELKQRNLLDLTITAGHAFGGDLEAVSIPSALALAKQALNPDLIIVALGPGIVGTGTALGFSGIEQSWIIDLTARMAGVPIAVPRISTADPRERHRGISHHTATILDLTSNPALLGLSRRLSPDLLIEITANLGKLLLRHEWYLTDEPDASELFATAEIRPQSMGRGLTEDPAFFQTTIAAGFLAAQVSQGKLKNLVKITG